MKQIPVAIAITCLLHPGGLSAQRPYFDVGPNVQVSADLADRVHVEPVIAASPQDPLRLAAAVMVVDSPHVDGWQDTQRVRVYASRDGGRNWSQRPLTGLPEGWMAGDPWLAWSDDDVLYLSCLVSESMLDGEPIETWVFSSMDGGWTWSEPLPQAFAAGTAQDHPVIATARGPEDAPILYAFGSVADGRPDGIDLAVHDPKSSGFRALDSYISGWAQMNLGSGVVLPGGGLVFTYFTMPEAPRGFWAVSGDGNGAWTEVRLREDILPVGFPMLAVDRSEGGYRGRVYAVWVEGPDQVDLRVWLSSSDDAGRSWSEPVRVHQHSEPTQRTLPFVAVNGDGVVAVSWLDWRGTSRADCTELYWARSTDGGASFHPEVRISSETACFGTAANGAAAMRWRLGGGDYHGMAATADGAFHVIWPDSRTGRFQAWTATVRAR